MSIINTTPTTFTSFFIQNLTVLCFFFPSNSLMPHNIFYYVFDYFQVLIEDVLSNRRRFCSIFLAPSRWVTLQVCWFVMMVFFPFQSRLFLKFPFCIYNPSLNEVDLTSERNLSLLMKTVSFAVDLEDKPRKVSERKSSFSTFSICLLCVCI